MGEVSMAAGGLALVTSPPASVRMAIPAATSLSSQPCENRIRGATTEVLPFPAASFPPAVRA